MHIGFEPMTLKKLHSFLVAAEAACSKGDFPVAAVEAKLAAVAGLAAAAVPILLAAAELELLRNASGAAQADRKQIVKKQRDRIALILIQHPILGIKSLFFSASNVEYSSGP